MASGQHLLAIDQGTTSSRAIIFSADGQVLTSFAQEFPQIYPQAGWVEHDPEAIWSSTLDVCRQALQSVDGGAGAIAGIGITNQRETVVLWDRKNGKPVRNAIVWQDRRTAHHCAQLKDAGHESFVAKATGLLLDPYFSATKISWMLDQDPNVRRAAEAGELLVGTIECFLLWRLTGLHATDATNASRTMLYNLETGDWDEELLALFRIPKAILPEIRDCVSDFGVTRKEHFGLEIPVRAMIGDQQSASVGQACIQPGMMKSTYGTGCFALVNTGHNIVRSQNRLLTTVAYSIDGTRTYAMEGSIFIAGAVVQWLRDEMGLVRHAAETEAIAKSIQHTNGVYLVPAFTGLGAPYWDAQARGAIVGLTRGTGRAEIVRAALEAMAYQSHDLISAMAADGVHPQRLRVDGGMVKNNWICQDLADILNIPIDRPKVTETTALGAALLAALGADIYGDLNELSKAWQLDQSFDPDLSDEHRQERLAGWSQAIAQVQAGSHG